MTRVQRVLLLVLAAVALTVATLELALGICPGALHLAPVALVLLPLLAGRFPGEQLLARYARGSSRRLWRRRDGQRWPRRVPPPPRRTLLTWDLAVRPPPVGLVVRP